MRKFVLTLAVGYLLLSGCKKTIDQQESALSPENEEAALTQRKCGADEVFQEQLKADPVFANRSQQIEEFTRKVMENPTAYRLLAGGTIEIPVVVNVLYRTSAQNVSLDQINSQITALNQDFGATNPDYNLTSTYDDRKSGDIGIRFTLDQVFRKSTPKLSWRLNDDMKKTNKGGIAPSSPATKLNIWVCNLSSGYLGYAQFPGGNPNTDGVVIDDNAFGTIGSATAPFNKGRTATHEVGHWANLRHIWGDATCGNDFVGDTPLHNTANYGCPSAGHRSTCSETPVEMTMNYMDYTDDACMYMFSAGQRARMLAVFESGGARYSFNQP